MQWGLGGALTFARIPPLVLCPQHSLLFPPPAWGGPIEFSYNKSKCEMREAADQGGEV
jgi:hypothetical protein